MTGEYQLLCNGCDQPFDDERPSLATFRDRCTLEGTDYRRYKEWERVVQTGTCAILLATKQNEAK